MPCCCLILLSKHAGEKGCVFRCVFLSLFTEPEPNDSKKHLLIAVDNWNERIRENERHWFGAAVSYPDMSWKGLFDGLNRQAMLAFSFFFFLVAGNKRQKSSKQHFTQPLLFICTQIQQRGEVARCITTDNMLNWLSGDKNKVLAKVEISDLYWDSILSSRDLQEKKL